MNIFIDVMQESWHLLLESASYILLGLLISGLLRIFLSPEAVANHLGKGRFMSVFKAAFFGIPIPLCSCGVLPAAAALKKQGANNGATTAFLIATPESGVDSIAITYALLDPIMTVVRPVAAFVMAVVAGVSENLMAPPAKVAAKANLVCPVDGCCDGLDCPPEIHKKHHSFKQKISAGVGYAFGDVWAELVGWFTVGLILAGLISALVPEDVMELYLGGGLLAMLLMLIAGIPLYICATASTPIAVALILKGVSPGAALVFLLAGPATNIAALTVLFSILGRRATAIYLTTIAVLAVSFGLAVDYVYVWLNISPQAIVGQAAEATPGIFKWAAALGLILISIKPVGASMSQRYNALKARLKPAKQDDLGFPKASKSPT